MLGLSLGKILLTILIIVAVWRGFILYQRLTGGSTRGRVAGRRARPAPSEPTAVDLIECPRCGAYVDPRRRCNCMRG